MNGAVMSFWAEDGVFEFPGRTPISGRHVGKPAVRAFFSRLFGELETMRFTIRHAALANPVGLFWSNVLFVEWTVDETTREGVSVHNEGVTVIRLRRGKAVSGRDCFFDPTIVDAAWPDGTMTGTA